MKHAWRVPGVVMGLMLGVAGSAVAGAAQRDGAAAGTGTAVGVGEGARGSAVRVAIVRTASLRVREGLVVAGGAFGKEVVSTFSAILVRRGDVVLLFDAGLGSQVDLQYERDMPVWQRPFFRYERPVLPVVRQLAVQGLPPVSRIILSHGHWDHASGLADFPGAEVWVAPEELAVLRQPRGGVGGAWASQVGAPSLRWRTLRFDAIPYEGFARSLDLFGDGSVVLVPLFGHTEGSVGMFVSPRGARRYFFVGDAVWSAAALRNGAPKFWPARVLVDHDAAATQAVIAQIRRVQRANPGLVVVPAHDGQVQAALGFFPRWLP